MNSTKNNEVYVITEKLQDVPFSESNYRVIGAAYSFNVAKKYAGLTGRIIKGPVPLFDEFEPTPIFHPFDQQPIPFGQPPTSFPRFNPLPANPHPFGQPPTSFHRFNPQPFNPLPSNPHPFNQNMTFDFGLDQMKPRDDDMDI